MNHAVGLEIIPDGFKSLEDALAYAPKEIRGTIAKRFYIERDKIVGNKRKKKRGTFNRIVERKPRRPRPGRSGRMGRGVAGAFRGRVANSLRRSAYISATIGVLGDNRFHDAIRGLQHGTFIRRANMLIPIWENLPVKKGHYGEFYDNMYTDNLSFISLPNATVVAFKDRLENGVPLRKAIGWSIKHQVTIRKYDFGLKAHFDQGYPKLRKRLQNAINRRLRAIVKGYSKGRKK